MKARLFFIFCALALFVLASSCVSGGGSASASEPTPCAEGGGRMRGVWVAAISGDFPRKKTLDAPSLAADCDFIVSECERLGFNAIFFQVRPSADALYDSKIFPWSAWLTGKEGAAPEDGFDPLAYMCRAARKKNIALHAWINPYRIKAKKGQSLSFSLRIFLLFPWNWCL